MRPTRWEAWIATAVLCGCGDAPPMVGIQWCPPEIDAGEVEVGRHWTGAAGWSVLAPVEFLGIKSSCGCSQATLVIGDQPVTPGFLAAGTAGRAMLVINADRQPGPRRETLSLLWRVRPGDPVQAAVLTLKATLVESYDVSPRAVLVTRAPRSQPTPFAVEWRPLHPVTGVPQLGQLPANVLVAGVEQELRAGSLWFRVQGMVNPPGPAETKDLLFSLQLEGLVPLPRPVPVHVQYARPVEVRPFGLVELREADPASAVGRVALTVTAAAAPLRVRGHRVEPAVLRERVRITAPPPEGASFPVDLTVSLQGDSFLRGSVLLELDPTELGSVEIPWIYFKKSTDPLSGGAQSVSVVESHSTKVK